MSLREIVLMLLVALSIPWVFKRPLWALTIYMGANILRPEMFFWGGTAGSYVFMVYAGLIVISSFFCGDLRDTGRIINRELLLMAWLLVAIIISIEFTQYPVYRAAYYVVELIKAFIICAFIYLIVSEFNEIRQLQNVLIGCFAFLGVWGIQQNFLGNERLEGLGGSSWGDSNGVAAVFVMYLPLALVKFHTSKTRKELWASACIVVIIVSVIILSQSRGGLLGLITSVAAFGFYSRTLRKIALVSLLVALTASPFLSESYVGRMQTMTAASDTNNLESSARSRLILWQAGLMVFSENALFGTGFMTFPEAKMKYEYKFDYLDDDFREWVFRTEYKKVAHNTYVQLLSDCGLFGAIPFFLLITGGVLTGFKARHLLTQFPDKHLQVKWLAGLCAGISGYAVCILFIDALLLTILYFQLAFIGILLKSIYRKADA